MSVHFEWPDDDDELHSCCLLSDIQSVGLHTTVIPVGEARTFALKLELHGPGRMRIGVLLVE